MNKVDVKKDYVYYKKKEEKVIYHMADIHFNMNTKSSLFDKILKNIEKDKPDYIIITGGTSNMLGIEYIVRDIFGDNASIGNIKLLGIRDNIYSSAIGNIVYFISKLKLKEMDYSMITDDDMYQITSVNSKRLSTSDSMLGKIFGFFFSE